MTAPPKRRWFQFSLKTLMIGMTVLCLGPGGYVAYEQNKARREKAAVEAIEKLGGDVYFFPRGQSRSATMRQILGDESFGNLGFVSFDATQVADADLSHLGGFKEIKDLRLDNTQVTDAGLVHLDGLTKLAVLSLSKTQVSDAGLVHLTGLLGLTDLWLDNTQVTDAGLVHFAGLKGLTQLVLTGRKVTDAGVAELQKALPNCKIVR